MTRPRFDYYRWFKAFIELLRQGVSPDESALTIAVGVTLGVTPVLGSTTLLCTLAAIVCRLNLPAIQMVNALVYPLQLILLIPFYRLGAWMFHAEMTAVSLQMVAELIRTGIGHAIGILWVVTFHALIVWLVFGAVTSTVLYVALVPSIRRINRKIRTNAAKT